MALEHRLRQVSLLTFVLHPLLVSCASKLSPRLENGLAITPPMGWNSYNHYSCSPNEAIVKSNAQALVDLGLKQKGYHYVTVDCGWTLPERTSNGTLTWNPDRFPSGYPALGEFIHQRGLGFGVYSDSGIKMCMTGTPDQAGSLGHEEIDAVTFASWGADLLKYDNCFSDAATGYPVVNYQPSTSPKDRMKTMSDALLSTSRPILYQICEWGIDFPSAWAGPMGNSWRITNDIIPAYRTVPRILNQAVPQTSFAGPGHWLDLDMLEVGNNVFTIPEEQTHFSLWAIIKSPLFIGAALKDTQTSISSASLAILSNTDVISYNQDSLGVAASFRRRWTEEGYEVWAGPLSGGRIVAAVINLSNTLRSLTLNFPDVGVQKVGRVKDIWNGITTTNVATSYTAQVGAHGTILLELSGVTTSGSYDSSFATSTSSSTTFQKVYGITTSSKYSAVLRFPAFAQSRTITVAGVSYSVPASATTLSIPQLALSAGATNSIAITPAISSLSLSITAPSSTFYPSTSFTIIGAASRSTCSTGLCTPVGSKIGFLSSTGSASLTITPPSIKLGPKFVEIYFTNNDIATDTAWGSGTNTRNMTISVNGKTTRAELPLSGRTSELFSPDHGWQDTGIFGVLIDGWVQGSNQVVVANTAGGLVNYGADFVGLKVLW